MLRSRKGTTEPAGNWLLGMSVTIVAVFTAISLHLDGLQRKEEIEFLSQKRDFNAVTAEVDGSRGVLAGFSKINELSDKFYIPHPYRVENPEDTKRYKPIKIGDSDFIAGIFYNVERRGDTLVFVGK